jgi:hypothetical protein
MIAVKIDVTKIDKSHLFEGKNGAKYLDVILIETPDNRFGNHYMAAQSVSKEARESGVKGPILGNGKVVGKGKPAAKKTASDEDSPF